MSYLWVPLLSASQQSLTTCEGLQKITRGLKEVSAVFIQKPSIILSFQTHQPTQLNPDQKKSFLIILSFVSLEDWGFSTIKVGFLAIADVGGKGL